LGIANRWVWCQEGAAPPKDATRVFTDSENSMTWARWSLIPLVPTPWVLFVDDDVELTGDGLNALRAYATCYPGGNLGLMGGRFKPPFTNYRAVDYVKARSIEQAEPVDMLWPKGQLISRDLAQRVYGEAHLWQRMREVVKGTSGDDLISGIAQSMLGLDPPVVVPTCEAPYREFSENSKYSLARQPGRYKAKRQSLPIWRSMGWLPLEMPGSAECLARLSTAERHGITVKQHPLELSEALDIVAAHPPRVFLEIGAYQGGSAYVYAGACEPGALLILVDKPRGDKHKALLEVAVDLLRDEGFEVLTVFGDSHSPETVATVKDLLAGRNVDLLHIDGDHSHKGVLADWERYAPLVGTGTALLHDIKAESRGARGVPKAWAEITAGRKAVEIYHGPWAKLDACGIGIVNI
ncbi:MAG TPA: class I SAM-dependent methyltransferase, partial [Phycisphaerae bacterium]|nr:class I SAM-dependent methyltransferase [Phycisphaerae bacterium]